MADQQHRNRNVSRRLLIATALGLLLITCTTETRAYDDDAHFWLTYYLAIKVGYTPLQAQQIASANITVDYDPQTEPLLPRAIDREGILNMFHAFPLTNVVAKLRVDLRRKKKLTCDGVLTNELGAFVECFLREQELLQWDEAKTTGNPGVYIHLYQDRFSHRGFTSRLGHYRLYRLPDFLASDASKAEEMALGTIQKLQDFMSECLIEGSRPEQPDIQQVMLVVGHIIQANPNKRLNDYYTRNWREWDPTFLRLPFPFISQFKDRPDVSLARKIVMAELEREVPAISSKPTTIYLYDLNSRGKPRQASAVGTLRERDRPASNRKVIRLLHPVRNARGDQTIAWRLAGLGQCQR